MDSITATKFHKHSLDNNLEGVNDCLSRGVDVNTKARYDECQWTALMVACGACYPAIVSRLLQVPGLDINYQDENGVTAAHLASMWAQSECVRTLAETARVDWNKADNWGRTPLYWAIDNGLSDNVEIIVKQPNIDFNVKSQWGETLAWVAVTRGSVQCVETLATQERCHCWNVPDRRGDTPIMKALKLDCTEIVEILLRCPRVDLGCRDREGWSLVFRAIQRNRLGEKTKNCSVKKIV